MKANHNQGSLNTDAQLTTVRTSSCVCCPIPSYRSVVSFELGVARTCLVGSGQVRQYGAERRMWIVGDEFVCTLDDL